MTIPSRLEIKCSSEGPTERNAPPPLPGGQRILVCGPPAKIDEDLEEDPMDLGTAHCNTMLTVTAPTLAMLATSGASIHVFLEQKEVISEAVQADEFVKPAVFEALAPNDQLFYFII
jgi:hypothetical protein